MASALQLWTLDVGPGAFLPGTQGHKIEPDLHLEARFDFFAFQGSDALLEQLAVEFEADGGDVAALLRPEEVSRASDFEIAHGDFESAAEGGVLFYGG